MTRPIKFGLYVLGLLALMEMVCRLAVSLSFGVPLFATHGIWTHFYPELEQLDTYRYDPGRTNLLVLGGSVLYGDTIVVEIAGSPVATTFCDLAETLPADRFNVVNLAQPGHNSLDSRYKYLAIPDNVRFDAAFVYHGINDTRANNIERHRFDAHYRHIEFYDDVWVAVRHPELRWVTAPFAVHWLGHRLLSQGRDYIPRELFRGLLEGKPEPFVLEGGDLKTPPVFRKNLEAIADRALQRKENFLPATYAWHIDPGYTLKAFQDGALDYGQHIYPIELYGMPEHVAAGLDAHNREVRALAESRNLEFIDAEAGIPRHAEYFNDVCHLSEAGCAMLTSLIEERLSPP